MTTPCMSPASLKNEYESKIEQRDMAAAHTLRAAFSKVEAQNPGFVYDLVKGILKKAEIDYLDMSECLLRLEGHNNSEEFHILRQEEAFKTLNERANTLKKILGRIPDEIHDRRRFLETIKDIANAIRNLLDAVNNIFVYIEGQSNKQALEFRKREFVRYSRSFSNTLKDFFKDNDPELNWCCSIEHKSSTNTVALEMLRLQSIRDIELRKRDFVKYSKRFSNTLKEYFKDNGKHYVFQSANHLINQTNLIMKTVKDACQ
ncbi:hypothetical protein LSH36_708g01135 [Paralvinella palmiformis]|uniref:Programmed cell death protein 10 dimerisation domain-containing protein n=1 Tax=Paralvinella palmiformis TaxID=53620 RepID=A0AAD9J2U7_9ANNE|nr:hypothetical protein LSH36_708g01135 [Paralvinella palmiformis]